MSFLKSAVALTASLSFAISLSSCAQAASSRSETAHGKTSKTAPTPYNKPGIPLTLGHGKLVTVSPGEAATLTLTLSPTVNGSADLVMSSRTGLDLAGASTLRVTLVEGVPQTLDLDVSSSTSGRHYLDVVATLDGIPGTRAVSIPVQIGEGGVIGKSTPGTLMEDADGNAAVAMPAAETINGVVVRDPSQEALQPR